MVEGKYRSAIARPPHLHVAGGPSTKQPSAIGRVSHCPDVQILGKFQERFPGTYRKDPDGGVLYLTLRLIDSSDSQRLTIGRKAYADNLAGKIQRLQESPIAPIPDLRGLITPD